MPGTMAWLTSIRRGKLLTLDQRGEDDEAVIVGAPCRVIPAGAGDEVQQVALRRTEHLHSRKPVERLHLEGVDRKRELVTVRVGQIDPITGFELVERGENCGTRHAIEVAVDHRLAGRAGPDAR